MRGVNLPMGFPVERPTMPPEDYSKYPVWWLFYDPRTSTLNLDRVHGFAVELGQSGFLRGLPGSPIPWASYYLERVINDLDIGSGDLDLSRARVDWFAALVSGLDQLYFVVRGIYGSLGGYAHTLAANLACADAMPVRGASAVIPEVLASVAEQYVSQALGQVRSLEQGLAELSAGRLNADEALALQVQFDLMGVRAACGLIKAAQLMSALTKADYYEELESAGYTVEPPVVDSKEPGTICRPQAYRVLGSNDLNKPMGCPV